MEAYQIGTFEVGARLKQLVLKRFRGVEGELEVSFDKDLTVFIGVNGAGKSTILDATAGLLDELACIIQNEPYKPEQYFGFFDVNNEQGMDGTAEISLTFSLDFPKSKDVLDENDKVIGSEWERIERYDYKVILELKRGKNLSTEIDVRFGEDLIGEDTVRNALRKDLNEWLGFSSDPSFALHTAIALPVLAYFTVRNIKADTNDDDRPVDTDLFANYRNHELSSKSFSFGVLKKWLALQYLMKTQERKRPHEPPRDRKLFDTILGAIKQFINDEGDDEAYADIYFEWTPDFPNGEMVLDKKGGSVYYRQLSSGEKAVIALVADLARQLTLSNPNAENPLQGLGVVLIDEIDLHLHPSWQRRLVPKLREVFPNVQFVVTTHSPMVLSSVNSSQGRVVKNGIIKNVGYVEGRDATSILEDEFGEKGRRGDLMEQLDEFYNLLKGNRDMAESVLDDLKKRWGEDDSEIIRAESYLDIF